MITYMLVDGENIDRTLGQILDAKPRPDQRPRWDRIKGFIEKQWGQPCRALFFLNARNGLPGSFIQALKVAKYHPVPVEGPTDSKVVDTAVNRTLEALRSKQGDVVLVSHDSDFYDRFRALDDGRKLALLGFEEYLSAEFNHIDNLQIFDLESDASAFNGDPLPRTRVTSIENFDADSIIS